MNIRDIKKWFEVAIPEPTVEQACIQIGCHFEEVGEMAVSTGDIFAAEELEKISREYKNLNAHYSNDVESLHGAGKVKLLDDLCGQIVTAVGVAHMLGMDIEGALKEVNNSNHSKFEGGKAVFDYNGRISNGKYYRKPELAEFINELEGN